ncbi:PRC-barrel domain-containing protein [Roseibium sp. M-1]
MLRNLLTTTALVAMVSTAAIASDTTQMPAGTSVDGGNKGVYEFELHTLSPDAISGILATNMIGKSVLASESTEGEEIGDINDVVIGRDGKVHAVVVGVGGFLGIGEKNVALDFSRLTFVSGEENNLTVVSDVSREELESATAYERPDYIPDWTSTATISQQESQAADSDPMTTAKAQTDAVKTEAVAPVAGQPVDEAMTGEDDWTSEKVRVDIATVSTDDLIGASIYTAENTDIGEISEVLLDEDGKAKAVIIDVGGFLGFNEKPVAVSYESLQMFETENGDLLVTASFTKEQLEDAEAYNAEAYKADPDAAMLKS